MGIKKMLGIRPNPMIRPYRGYGSEDKVVVMGRVTEFQSQSSLTSSNRWRHALRLSRSYLARPLGGIEVQANFAGAQATTTTNETGVFEVELIPVQIKQQSGSEWYTAQISLPDYPETQSLEAPVLVEGANNTFGIISDIDDTVLISNATKKIKLLYAMLFKSPEHRLPFDGVSQLYSALVRGVDASCSNPLFYVSSSHWNLYDFLVRFFDLNQLPTGPLLLKRTTTLLSLITSTGKHGQKYDAIVKILEAYPSLSFILIGDSGQKDAEIYSDIVSEYPGRILVIYIRDISISSNQQVGKTIRTINDSVPLVSAKTSHEIATHAAEQGFISNEALATIAAEFSTP